MAFLAATLIDVGWGDSIFIESEDADGDMHYGLIDSNDFSTLRSSYIFLKRHFEKKNLTYTKGEPVFDFVLLSHPHSDHSRGLKPIMREFSTQNFWYPKSKNWAGLTELLAFANRKSKYKYVRRHQAIDSSYELPDFGDVKMNVLWPVRGEKPSSNQNNNSIVLEMKLDNISFLFTGDAEHNVWKKIATDIPSDTRFFKVPHHGSVNGSLDDNGNPIWLNDCPKKALLGISSHVFPHTHPDKEVIKLFTKNKREYYRTDKHFHLIFNTDGTKLKVKYSHY